MAFKLSNFHNQPIVDTDDFIDSTWYESFTDFYISVQHLLNSEVELLFHGGSDSIVFPSAYFNTKNKNKRFW